MALQTAPSRQPARSIDTIILTEVMLLGGVGALLVIKWMRDQLAFYIHPRYTLLMLVTALVLVLMAAVRMRSILYEPGTRPPARPGWVYFLLAIPLLFGILVPARPLGADSLTSRGLDLTTAPVGRTVNLGNDPSVWNLLEWGTALTVRGDELDGQAIDVIGFVYHDPEATLGDFYVVRYVVTCCAADGAGVGMPVVWSGGEGLVNNNWVRVRGNVSLADSQPQIIAESIEPVDQPRNPYLYP